MNMMAPRAALLSRAAAPVSSQDYKDLPDIVTAGWPPSLRYRRR
jgi:hypothetical protein